MSDNAPEVLIEVGKVQLLYIEIKRLRAALVLCKGALDIVTQESMEDDDWCPFCRDHLSTRQHEKFCPRALALQSAVEALK